MRYSLASAITMGAVCLLVGCSAEPNPIPSTTPTASDTPSVAASATASASSQEGTDPIAVSVRGLSTSAQPMRFNVYTRADGKGQIITLWQQKMDSDGQPISPRGVLGWAKRSGDHQIVPADRALSAGQYDIQASIGSGEEEATSYTLKIDVP